MKKVVVLGVFLFAVLTMFVSVLAVQIEEEVWVDFASQGGSCVRTDSSSRWVDSQALLLNWTVNLNGDKSACLLPDGSGGYLTNVSCCPLEWNCQTHVGSGPEIEGGICVDNIKLCSNAGYKTDCELLNHGEKVAEYTSGEQNIFNIDLNPALTSLGLECFTYTAPQCVWQINASNNPPGSCVVSVTKQWNINDTVNGTCPYPEANGTCVLQPTNQQDNCDNAGNNITIDYSAFTRLADGTLMPAVGTDIEAWCKDKSVVYSCSASIRLPAFNFSNALFSIFGIGMVYFLYKKNFKRKI